ncbi:amidohydrolase family protein [Phenylobacterium deserti]|uniref:Amidohydrolase n=1 Tax=Phenylobacterium deserti TaxID=1914756 RepID=A0A328A8G9_9CAUL|nr:amidohydrolase family protein [Phenylobacterium deserti]RAK50765.1 amidohydrolase [Phenylobacterium deserti]
MKLSRLRHRLAAAVAAGACALGLGSAAQAETTVLKNFTLIDGTGAAPAPNSGLIIQDGRITWVGPAASLRAPAGASTVDLSGKYVMPGLIDLHVHLGNVVGVVQNKNNFTRENVEKDLTTFAKYGVTTVQSMGTDGDLIFPLRAEQRAGRPNMARVYTAGQGLVFKGGYGGVPNLNNQVSTPAEATAEVNRQADKGVDFIKMWVDDELKTMPKMPPEITKAIIDAAHARKLRAVAHIFYLDDAKTLVNQGVDGFAHSVRDQKVDRALLDSMKRRGVWQIAETLSREEYMFAYGKRAPFLDDPFFAKGVSPDVIATLASPQRQQQQASNPHFHELPQFLDNAIANLAAQKAAGVKIGFGTDSGPPARFPGYSSHRELELMVKAGYTPAEALHIATGVSAEFLGSKDLGLVKPNRWADLLVLDANPTTDIRNTRTIRAVYVAGREVPNINQ